MIALFAIKSAIHVHHFGLAAAVGRFESVRAHRSIRVLRNSLKEDRIVPPSCQYPVVVSRSKCSYIEVNLSIRDVLIKFSRKIQVYGARREDSFREEQRIHASLKSTFC